jgi:beta-glucosidase/6-phospho-beta-glucosidase/beta-galactosidase
MYPAALEAEFGGWNNDRMIDAFVEFADFVFSQFGDRVSVYTDHTPALAVSHIII